MIASRELEFRQKLRAVGFTDRQTEALLDVILRKGLSAPFQSADADQARDASRVSSDRGKPEP